MCVCVHSVYVVANYALANALQPTEIQSKSTPIRYTTLGPPPAVTLRALSTDIDEVCPKETTLSLVAMVTTSC